MRMQGKGRAVAYPAILGALALIFVYAASVVPSGSWGLVAVAGLFPAAAVISVGMKAGALCWAGVSILSFLLVPDKFCALLFVLLLGLYPIVKAFIERIKNKLIGYFLKLAFFNAAFTVVFVTMSKAVLNTLPALLGSTWLMYLTGNIVFLVYDYGLSKLIALYIARIKRASSR